jgi:hypothetical protein
MLTLVVSLWLAVPFPSSSPTGWMRPDAFHLRLGMTHADAAAALARGGWKQKGGKNEGEVIVEYAEGKTLTLQFSGGTLVSARFELVTYIAEVRKAFETERSRLRALRGAPKLERPGMVFYEGTSPGITLVMSEDKGSSFGRQGLGFVVTRYFVAAGGP